MNIDQPSGILPSNETYFFLHIAKTAGSTFVNILDNLFPQNEICPAYYTLDLREFPPEDLANYRFFRGHINYHLIDSLLHRKLNTFVFLRNPYDLAISIHSHIRRKDDQDFLDTDIKNLRRLTLKDYIYNPSQILSLDYANLQIRALTAKVRLDNINNDDEDFLSQNSDASNLDNPLYARKLLNDFMFVGLAERFEESMQLFSYTLGIRPIKVIPRINVGDNKPEHIPTDVYNMITRYSNLDLQLYTYAQQLFDQRFTAMSGELLKRYATSEQTRLQLPLPKEVLYDLLEKHYQATFRERHNPVDSLLYRFDQPLVGDNWYNSEINTDHGIYRWSGPEAVSTLDFPLALDSDLRIKFEVLMAITPAVLESLELEIEGEVIPLKSSSNASGILTFEGIIPTSVLTRAKGLTRLIFKVKETIVPGSIYPGNMDKRQLGFALNNVEISPITIGIE